MSFRHFNWFCLFIPLLCFVFRLSLSFSLIRIYVLFFTYTFLSTCPFALSLVNWFSVCVWLHYTKEKLLADQLSCVVTSHYLVRIFRCVIVYWFVNTTTVGKYSIEWANYLCYWNRTFSLCVTSIRQSLFYYCCCVFECSLIAISDWIKRIRNKIEFQNQFSNNIRLKS